MTNYYYIQKKIYDPRLWWNSLCLQKGRCHHFSSIGFQHLETNKPAHLHWTLSQGPATQSQMRSLIGSMFPKYKYCEQSNRTKTSVRERENGDCIVNQFIGPCKDWDVHEILAQPLVNLPGDCPAWTHMCAGEEPFSGSCLLPVHIN